MSEKVSLQCSDQKFFKRVKLIKIIVIILMILLAGKLFYIQIIGYEEFSKAAKRQQQIRINIVEENNDANNSNKRIKRSYYAYADGKGNVIVGLPITPVFQYDEE